MAAPLRAAPLAAVLMAVAVPLMAQSDHPPLVDADRELRRQLHRGSSGVGGSHGKHYPGVDDDDSYSVPAVRAETLAKLRVLEELTGLLSERLLDLLEQSGAKDKQTVGEMYDAIRDRYWATLVRWRKIEAELARAQESQADAAHRLDEAIREAGALKTSVDSLDRRARQLAERTRKAAALRAKLEPAVRKSRDVVAEAQEKERQRQARYMTKFKERFGPFLRQPFTDPADWTVPPAVEPAACGLTTKDLDPRQIHHDEKSYFEPLRMPDYPVAKPRAQEPRDAKVLLEALKEWGEARVQALEANERYAAATRALAETSRRTVDKLKLTDEYRDELHGLQGQLQDLHVRWEGEKINLYILAWRMERDKDIYVEAGKRTAAWAYAEEAIDQATTRPLLNRTRYQAAGIASLIFLGEAIDEQLQFIKKLPGDFAAPKAELDPALRRKIDDMPRSLGVEYISKTGAAVALVDPALEELKPLVSGLATLWSFRSYVDDAQAAKEAGESGGETP